MISAILAGDYIIASGQGRYTPMEVLKLAYIGNGFTLAVNDEPLFHDRIEAWEHGPVIPNLYQVIKQHGLLPIPRLYLTGYPVGSEASIQEREAMGRMMGANRQVLDQVLEAYSGADGDMLSSIAHSRGSPWDQVYDAGCRTREIPAGVIKKYYRKKLERNQALACAKPDVACN